MNTSVKIFFLSDGNRRVDHKIAGFIWWGIPDTIELLVYLCMVRWHFAVICFQAVACWTSERN
jgi:hypothetical protein